MPQRPITIRDIAEHTGLGLATVSRALNNRPKVSAAARKTVLEAAETLGYRADPAMRLFVQRRWPERHPSRLNIGVLAPPQIGGTETERFIKSLQNCATEAGFQLIRLSMGELRSAAALRRRMLGQGVSGLFVPPMPKPESNLSPVFKEFPAVLCAPAEYSPALPLVGPDDYLRSKHAWTHVHKRGYRRIGIVLPDHSPAESVDARMSGLLIGWAQQEPLIPIFRHGPRLNRPALMAWFTEHRPDAIIGYEADTMKLLADCGIPLGKGVGYAALYLFRESERRRVPGSFYARERIGRRAWDRLEFMIQNQLSGHDLRDTKELIDMPYTAGASLPVI